MEARPVGSSIEPELVEYDVIVPEGVKPKEAFSTTLPNGRNILIICPEKAQPGMILTVAVPAAKTSKAPTLYEVEVPDGVKPGESFEVVLPNGLTATVTCPEPAKTDKADLSPKKEEKNHEGGHDDESETPSRVLRFQGPDERKLLSEMVKNNAKNLYTTVTNKEQRKKFIDSAKEKNKGRAKQAYAAGKKIVEKVSKAKTTQKAVERWDKLSEKQKRAIQVVALTYLGLPKPAMMLASYDAIAAVVDMSKSQTETQTENSEQHNNSG